MASEPKLFSGIRVSFSQSTTKRYVADHMAFEPRLFRGIRVSFS